MMVTITPLPIKDAYIIHQHPRYHDERGFLSELLNMENYPPEITKHFPVMQNTIASSRKNALRGIHVSTYAKLMTCVRGAVYDFIVDYRPDSPTFLQWTAVVISDTNLRQLLVPPNCGHGYLALEEETMCVYCQGGCFDTNERLISPHDPVVNMFYPIPADVTPILSAKDIAAPCVNLGELALTWQPKRTRVLIISASGQVGGALRDNFEQHGDRYIVFGTYSGNPIESAMPFDLEKAADDADYCEMILTTCRPDVIIICAAFSWVDGCERNPDKGQKLNASSVRQISQLAQSFGSKVVLYSTDYVFDGADSRSADDPESWYDEASSTHPVNLYGQQKLDGEVVALETNERALVIRTSRVFGPEMQGENFVYQVSQRLRNKEKVPCLKDEVSCPTYNVDLAEATRLLVENDSRGVYHCAGPDAWSKYDWGVHTASYFGLDTSLIDAVNPSTESNAAARPQMVAMATKKLRMEFPQFKFHTFVDALAHWKQSGKGKPLDWPAMS